MTEDEIFGWHHRPDGHKFEQTPGDGEGQGSLACCSPQGCKESDTTWQLDKLTTCAASSEDLEYTAHCSLSNDNDETILS